jgi:hypothetical protein
MDWTPASIFHRWFDSQYGASDRLIPRWLFLRALGVISFSAFYSLLFQIRGLIAPEGILPASEYLEAVAKAYPQSKFWFAPTLLWMSSGPHMLTAICWIGMVASLLLVFNLWPRTCLVMCFVCYLSFVCAAGDFSGYQSDGMLLEAGFIALFFAPPGLWPRWGTSHPPSRASLFLLQWEWFRIYFESGVVKLLSGDPEWRNFTAMDEYYQNGPLPTWIGWYVQHLPHWFHAFAVFFTLATELVLVWMMFLPRRFRILCFFIVTALQISIILTANYTFLNYIVLSLGVLLLDDRFLLHFWPKRWRKALWPQTAHASHEPMPQASEPAASGETAVRTTKRSHSAALKLALTSVVLIWIFYATTAQMLWTLFPRLPLPTSPVAALEPFRIANRYGLFAVMTRGRYEIEFQGSNDGQEWTAYPFRYKPHALNQPPGIYAPYQPRLDWNLWFASLGFWRDYPIVTSTEERLLAANKDVLSLFAGNPFSAAPPRQVRAVLWQYWFTSMAEKRASGDWWKRKYLGIYAPVLERQPDGKLGVVEWPTPLPPRE